MEWIEGKKTYIGAVIVFALGGLLALGVIDQKTFEVLIAVFGGYTAFSMRHGISKLSEDVKRLQ